MDDINDWQTKFESCQYSDKLIAKLTLINKAVQNPVDIQEVKKAIYYARKYHGSQIRQSGEPYYSHPLETAYLFAEHVGMKSVQYYTTDLIITAILHDVIEDTDLTRNMIAQIFNNSIANKVEDLTRIKFDQKITAGENVNLLFTQYKQDVLHVKLFDRLHNVQTIKYMSSEKIKRIIDETIIYFIPLCSCLGLGNVQKDLAKLCIKAELTGQELVVEVAEQQFSLSESYHLPPISENALKKIYKISE